jgi:hypothetical protein
MPMLMLTASVFVDRVTGLIGLLLLTVICAAISTKPEADFVIWPSALVIVALLSVVLLLRVQALLTLSKSIVERLLHRVALLKNQTPKVLKLVDHLAAYSRAAPSVFVSILIGTLYQSLLAGIIYIIAQDIGITIAFYDIAWIFGMISLLTFLPISISGTG